MWYWCPASSWKCRTPAEEEAGGLSLWSCWERRNTAGKGVGVGRGFRDMLLCGRAKISKYGQRDKEKGVRDKLESSQVEISLVCHDAWVWLLLSVSFILLIQAQVLIPSSPFFPFLILSPGSVCRSNFIKLHRSLLAVTVHFPAPVSSIWAVLDLPAWPSCVHPCPWLLSHVGRATCTVPVCSQFFTSSSVPQRRSWGLAAHEEGLCVNVWSVPLLCENCPPRIFFPAEFP